MSELHHGEHRPATHPAYNNFVMAHVMQPILNHYGGIEYSGAENLTGIEGPAIIAPKHSGKLDIPATAQVVLETTGDQITFLAKEDLGKPVLKQLIKYGDGIIIDRSDLPTEDDMATITQRAYENALFGIFAEGERRPGELITPKSVKRGLIGLAFLFGMPIVPAGIAGTNKKDRGPMRLVFGEPIELGHAEGVFDNERELVKLSREPKQRIATEIAKLQLEAEAWSQRDTKD